MFIYEKERSHVQHYFYYQPDTSLSFPLHVHTTYELVCVLDGSMLLVVDNQNYELKTHQCALIFPNQIHAYQTMGYSKSVLCVFSSDLIDAYHNDIHQLRPVNPIFHLDLDIEDYFQRLNSATNLYERKSLLYHMISIFHRKSEYQEKIQPSKDFVGITLQFIENQFTEDITLFDLAHRLGYDYNYTSGLFNRTFQLSFSDLVNRYRINHALYLLKTTEFKISDISFQCGFSSLRAFNRNFMKFQNQSPSMYKKSITK